MSNILALPAIDARETDSSRLIRELNYISAPHRIASKPTMKEAAVADLERGQVFAERVFEAVSSGKFGMSRKELSDHLELDYQTFNSRLYGRNCFSADEIQKLVELKPDLFLVEYFLEKTEYFIAKRPNHTVKAARSIQTGVIELEIETGQLLEQVHKALEDVKICHRDKGYIQDELTDVERALATLTKALEEGSPPIEPELLSDI